MISRRAFAFGSVAALAAAPSLAFAETSCKDYTSGMRICTVSVDIEPIIQANPHWCWAACIAAIFAFNNHEVDQRRIVERALGAPYDEAISGTQIISVINGQWVDKQGDSFDATAELLWDVQSRYFRPDAMRKARLEMESDNPLIVGALGHTVLLTSLTYRIFDMHAENKRSDVDRVDIGDPWPGNPRFRALTAVELQQTTFLASVQVG
jgi:hypothetical protein